MSKNLSDKECILVEFCNEKKKPVQVGFQAWLQDKENVANNINKQVIIKWPVNVNVVCARAMERKLAKCNRLEWKSLVVTILAIGGKYLYLF